MPPINTMMFVEGLGATGAPLIVRLKDKVAPLKKPEISS
jgi:hypothetical protein